jgi:hypothetical protein
MSAMSDLVAEWRAAELALQQTVRPAVMLIAVAASGLLFGSLIAGLSEGGLTPGLVILGLAAPAFVGGLVWVRRLARLHRFRLVFRTSVPIALLMLACGVAAVAVSLAIGAALGIAGGILMAVLLPLVVRFYVGLRTAVLMSFAGIQVAYQRLPWAAVQHVVVSDSQATDEVMIGVRLRENAELPAEVQLTDPTPADADAPHLTVAVPRRRVDHADLAAAVRRFAPSRTRVVTRASSGQAEAF